MAAAPNQTKRQQSPAPDLPPSWAPSSVDIICARGKLAAEHIGNQRLKALVKSHLPMYASSRCKFQKSKIVSQIVETVRLASPKGGFVKFSDEKWVRVSDRHAREKVGQLFRDCLFQKYKSSTKAKAQSRRDKNSSDDSCSHSSTNSQQESYSWRGGHKQGHPVAIKRPLPLPEFPPSLIRVERMTSSPSGNVLDSKYSSPLNADSKKRAAALPALPPSPSLSSAATTWRYTQQSSNNQDRAIFPRAATFNKTESLQEISSTNHLMLPNYEPLPIDESTINTIFDISCISNDPESFFQNVSTDNIDAVCDIIFDECL